MKLSITQSVKVFKALANTHRLDLFLKIKEAHELNLSPEAGEKDEGCMGKECFLNKIMGNLGVGPSTLSHHLKELVNANLIETEKRGKFLICRPNLETIEQLKSLFLAHAERPSKKHKNWPRR